MVARLVRVAQAVAFARGRGDDRVAVVEHAEATIVAVADGAGGMSGGALAAEQAISMVRAAAATPSFAVQDSRAWIDLLERADLALEAHRDAGETTCVVVAITQHGLVGASAGDSGAWLVHPAGIDDLTARQSKRRLGSGIAQPAAISPGELAGTLLLATDGLLARARPERIAAAAMAHDLEHVAHALIELVRSPAGALEDDVGVVLARRA